MKTTPVNPNSSRRWVLRTSFAVIILALIPHLGKGAYDVLDGMRIGSSATNNILSSTSSVMIGQYNSGAGPSGLAVGSSNVLGNPYWNAYASGTLAAGSNNKTGGSNSVAFGASNNTIGIQSMAAGYMNTSVAASSIALGECNSTNGIGSVALGRWNIANADSSLSTGWHTTAWGNYSQAGGFFTNANSYSSVALGQYNAAMGTETVPAEVTAARTTWRGSDSLFVIGNGTGDTARSNALALKKNGELTLKANSSGPAIVLDPNTSTITINGHPINVQSGALCIDSQPLVLQGDSIVKADSLAIGIPVTHNGNANVTPLTVSAVYDPYQNGGKVT
jgi:hypothetical protein